MSVFEIVFSPTGGTQKVSGLVAGALGKNTVTVDLTDSGLDFNAVSMTEDDVAVISVPAYAGRIPAVVADHLERVAADRGTGPGADAPADDEAGLEIGRASCRERVSSPV